MVWAKKKGRRNDVHFIAPLSGHHQPMKSTSSAIDVHLP